MCVYLSDPSEVLLRKPPPAVHASFFQRVKFIFEGEKGVQRYVRENAFEQRSVSGQ